MDTIVGKANSTSISEEVNLMIERVKHLVTEHKTALLVTLCILLIGVAYAVGRHSASEQTAAEKLLS